jgi:hypothetical protein
LAEISPFSREVHSSTQGGWLMSDGEASWDGAPKKKKGEWGRRQRTGFFFGKLLHNGSCQQLRHESKLLGFYCVKQVGIVCLSCNVPLTADPV